MSDLGHLIDHWGYLAIFAVVILGNLGVPIPEETILILAGYLAWDGRLRLPLVLGVGILSATLGDNLGYWIGRELGGRAIERYGHWILLTPERLDSARRLVARRGVVAVFAARFIAGVRFLAGPVAGVTGLRPLPFLAANLAGACVYVPIMVGVGYAAGYGLGAYLARLERIAGRIEHLVWLLAVGLTLLFLAGRAMRALRSRPGG